MCTAANASQWAIIKLTQDQERWEHVKIQKCGIIFLGTPNSGSLAAHRSPALIHLGKVLFGIRPYLVNVCQVFNNIIAENTAAWKLLGEAAPPYHCFHETESTIVNLIIPQMVWKMTPTLPNAR